MIATASKPSRWPLFRSATTSAAIAALLLSIAAWSVASPPAEDPAAAFNPERPQWMRASWNLELRRLVEGERARGLAALPPGGGAGVQLFQFVEPAPESAPPEAVLLPAVGGEAALYANGAPIFEPAEASAPHLALAGSRAELVPVPREYWTAGRNRIDLVVSGALGRAVAAEPLWGREAPLRAAAERWTEWTAAVQLFAAPLALVAAVLCLLAALGRRPGGWFEAGLALLALGLRALLARPESASALGPGWAGADAALLLAALAAGAALVPRIWGSARPDAAGALVGLVAATAAFGLWGLAAPSFGPAPLAIEAGYGIGLIALAGLGAGAGGRATARRVAGFARGHLHLSRLVRRQRQELHAASQALQEEMRRRAILEERQRLARDMHDGIGGQLVSLIARVRAGGIGVEEVETALAEGLTDLRLIVDSLDSAGESLAGALAAFEMRARPEIEAAGMRFAWVQPEGIGAEPGNPRRILDLYRFLQEAVSNAVRHSRGTRLEVEVARGGDGALEILVADDGVGIPELRPAGRGAGKGLRNMALRANRLGGECRIERGPDGRGTRISLSLPAAGPAQSSGEISPS